MGHMSNLVNNAMLVAHQESSDGTPEEIEQDGYALATNLSMQDSSLQGNTKAHNNLQLCLGPKPKVSNDGKTIAELRAAEKKRRQDQAPPPPVPDDMVASFLAQKDSRFS